MRRIYVAGPGRLLEPVLPIFVLRRGLANSWKGPTVVQPGVLIPDL